MNRLVALIAAASLSACGVIDDGAWVKARSNDYYTQRGFEVVGHQGYSIGVIGRCYWYTLRKDGITYESCLLKWGNEVHEYNLRAIDAIRPR